MSVTGFNRRRRENAVKAAMAVPPVKKVEEPEKKAEKPEDEEETKTEKNTDKKKSKKNKNKVDGE